ncbi:MAG: penicillin-binding protein 1C, partial [Rhodobacteraceae bacterium]|nr:penicillin-binding protein 1C [Paracoccaceae bacterium]
ADGTPVPGAFGGGLAAPVLFAAFERLEQPPVPLGPPPPETLIVANVALPAPLQRFGSAADDRAEAMQIVYPPEGAMIEGSTVVARIEGGTAPFIWLANGALIARTNRRELVLPGFELGFSVLAVIDARSRSDNVGFELRLP